MKKFCVSTCMVPQKQGGGFVYVGGWGERRGPKRPPGGSRLFESIEHAKHSVERPEARFCFLGGRGAVGSALAGFAARWVGCGVGRGGAARSMCRVVCDAMGRYMGAMGEKKPAFRRVKVLQCCGVVTR